jgi:hypothetical protein
MFWQKSRKISIYKPYLLWQNMMTKKKWLLLLLLAVIVTGIRLVSADAVLIETRYSTGIYPQISAILKHLFGWLPFSFGDIIYWLIVVWLLTKTVKLIRAIAKKELRSYLTGSKVFSLVVIMLLIYILFNLLWGLNYNRQGIRQQLQIADSKYSIEELLQIDSILAEKVNESKAALIRQNKKVTTNKEIFDGVKKAYDKVSKEYLYLNYHTPSIKSSLWGWAGNYMGFTGYYNPFTGEAQVNTTVPEFLLPYTSCHEVAHQLGYAKENEANFVGYLAAVASGDTAFHYSAYLDLFLYAQSNLYSVDSVKAKEFYKKLIPEVNADLKELKEFYRSHKSPAGPLFKWIYGVYLQRNQQPSGLLSYDEVTGLLIAQYKKKGRI